MFEKIILQNIFHNEKYLWKYLTYFKPAYFTDNACREVFKAFFNYYNQYKKIPDKIEVFTNLFENKNAMDEHTAEECRNLYNELNKPDTVSNEWLANETEKWIKASSFKQAIIESARAVDEGKPLDGFAEVIKQSLAINFDESIGIDLKKDWQKMFDFYHVKNEKFDCNLSELNLICGGGVERKTINFLLAPTNTGKTSGMISLASSYLQRGKNVLYISYEMSEEKIMQRFHANLMGVAINDIPEMDLNGFRERFEPIVKPFQANLKVKEFPTSSTSTMQIRSLLDKLELKEQFIPDIVFLDYINLINPARYRSSANSYETIKSVAEEVRGLAVEKNICIWSATQTNRKGDGSSDLDITDVSESYGLPMTTDLMVAIIQTEELKGQGRQIWKNLKDRYSGLKYHKFLVEHQFQYCRVVDCNDKPNSNNEEFEDETEQPKTFNVAKPSLEAMEASNKVNFNSFVKTESISKNTISDDFF